MEFLARTRRWVRTNPLSAFIVLSIGVHLILILLISRRESSPRSGMELLQFVLAEPPAEGSREEPPPEISDPPPEPAQPPPAEEEIPPPPPAPPPPAPRSAAGVDLPAAPGSPAAGEADFLTVLAAYISSLQSSIDREIEYPLPASRQRREGEVTVVFTLHRSGRLRQLALAPGGRSGFEPFNREALRAVRRAAPAFPPFPESLSGEELTFSLPVIFSLR